MSKKDLSYIEASARYHRKVCSQAPLLKQGIYLSKKLCHFKGRNIISIVNAWKELPAEERHEYSIINSLEDQYNRSTKHNQKGDFTRGLPKKKSSPEISFKRTLSQVRASSFSRRYEKFNEDSKLVDVLCNSRKSTIQLYKTSQDRTNAYNLLTAHAPQNQSLDVLQRLNSVSKLSRNIENLSINIKSKRQVITI
jgi:hypothetical protein